MTNGLAEVAAASAPCWRRAQLGRRHREGMEARAAPWKRAEQARRDRWRISWLISWLTPSLPVGWQRGRRIDPGRGPCRRRLKPRSHGSSRSSPSPMSRVGHRSSLARARRSQCARGRGYTREADKRNRRATAHHRGQQRQKSEVRSQFMGAGYGCTGCRRRAVARALNRGSLSATDKAPASR